MVAVFIDDISLVFQSLGTEFVINVRSHRRYVLFDGKTKDFHSIESL